MSSTGKYMRLNPRPVRNPLVRKKMARFFFSYQMAIPEAASPTVARNEPRAVVDLGEGGNW